MSDLQHFVDAQARIYSQVASELRSGHKHSHWMWFIFPQLEGLGRSPTAQRYGLSGREQARAYLDHPVLGTRLRECVQITAGHTGLTAQQIFGFPDYLKFHSCLTLFCEVAEQDPVFRQTLVKFYDGRPDQATISLLR